MGVYDFGKNMTQEEAKAVSDRYPIELTWNLTSGAYSSTAVTNAATTSYANVATSTTVVAATSKGDITRKQTSGAGSTYANTATTTPHTLESDGSGVKFLGKGRISSGLRLLSEKASI